ncbi:MAG TPA: RNA methyltransferase [Myxococcales bacterium]
MLHRPRSSQNIGAAARALANTGAARLWVVEPVGFDRTQAARLAAGADYVLDEMRVVRTLDEALADCDLVVMTTGREVPGALLPEAAAMRLSSAAGEAALVFGDEVRGLSNAELSRAHAVTTVPTDRKSSLNLAQAVMVYGYEVMKARGTGRPLPKAIPTPLAPDRLLALARARSRELLLGAGFLNPQQPDLVLDELLALCRRAQPSHREMELILAALTHLQRAQRGKP